MPVPNPKQERALLEQRRYVAYGGARGGGKSWFVRWKATLLCLVYPGIRVLITRRTYKELFNNHILPLLGLLEGVAQYNKSEKLFRFPNGSAIFFGYCAADTDLGQYQGAEYDIWFADEAGQFPEEWLIQIDACVRGVNGFPKRTYYTLNPGGPSHGYFKRLFIDRDFRDNEHPEDYAFIQALCTDNQALLQAQPEYMRALEKLPPKLRMAWLEGRWDVYEGQFFEEFRAYPVKTGKKREFTEIPGNSRLQEQGPTQAAPTGVEGSCTEGGRSQIAPTGVEGSCTEGGRSQAAPTGVEGSCTGEQGRYTHVIAPFDLNAGERRRWPILRSYDFGYNKPFSVGWWTVDPDGVLYRVLELYGCTGTPNEGVRWTPDQQFRRIRQIEDTHPWLQGRPIQGVADPSIWDTSRGESIADTAARHGIYFTPGDNRRIPGWMQVHYRLQFDENGYPGMYIFSSCKAFIRTIPTLLYSRTDPEDLDTDQEDHVADEVRYLCMSRPIKPKAAQEELQLWKDPLK